MGILQRLRQMSHGFNRLEHSYICEISVSFQCILNFEPVISKIQLIFMMKSLKVKHIKFKY